MVADRGGDLCDGGAGERLQPAHRRAARRAGSKAEMSLLSVRDLAVDFRIDEATTLRAVKGISFDIDERSTVALVGESGSGKSVTALAIMGLLPRENARVHPASRVEYLGRKLLELPGRELQALRGAEISMIFQEPMSSLNPVFTVGFQIAEVLRQHRALPASQARLRALQLLGEVGLAEPQARLGAYPFQLSGGEQQRVMIAMAIACEPKLLIADEPTTALDVTVQRQILELIAGLEARGLAKSFYFRDGLFGRRELKAVKGASFKLAKGKTLGVVGESGSGKTTVGLLLMRLHKASGGEVLFEGRDLLPLPPKAAYSYKRRIQIVFQNPYASLNPRFTVGQILVEPMQIHGVGSGEAERRALTLELLDKVGLAADSFAKYPHEFSGGQRQRIAIARALTLRPEVLICDESVSALDVSVQAQLLNLLQDLQDEYAMSYLFISHDLAVVRYMADQVMVMKDGEIVEIAGPDEIYSSPKHPYTRLLLSSMPGRAQ